MINTKSCNDQQMAMLAISLQNQTLPGSLEYSISDLYVFHILLLHYTGYSSCRYMTVQPGDQPSNLMGEMKAKMAIGTVPGGWPMSSRCLRTFISTNV
ncbi:MAG: hypothetical protein ACOYXO_09465 [Chloroflexota bacterium]